MEWAINAYIRIAMLDGISKDAAFLAVRQEVASMGAAMPEAPGS
jgi:hypothetical protein